MERFEWSWSASNIEQLQSLLAPIELRGSKVYSATSTELDVVVVDIARIRDSVDDAEREALRTGFAALRMDLIEAWGGPDSDIVGETGSLVWVLPQVVVQLNYWTDSVYYRLVSHDAHRSVEAAERASRERDEQRTDFAPFLAVLPRIANAHLGSWSRSDLDPLFEAVGWPIDIGEGRLFREDLVAELNGNAVRAWLRATRTAEFDADRWDFGEYSQLELSQSLSSRVVPEAYAAALRSCVELLGPPPVVGGPAAQAIWRGADVTYTLSTSGGWLRFTATPTAAVEGREYWEWKWNDCYPEGSWRVTTGADGVRFGTRDWWVPEPDAETWSMLDDYIAELFPSLAGDLALLAPYATRVVWGFQVAEDPGIFIRGWFSDESAGLEIHLPEAEPYVRSYPPAFESGRQIAAETTAALRKFGVESPADLEMVALAPSGTQKLDTIRLGFAE
ncbi:DUF6301 family protein [Prescottella agglutinans]|uniref:DUF4132 domain-containing protein n=1 Tax=Prescottella agglutinans TaxID=1644129 RepID=A0ABT6M6G2_9NOCA|nr:DUF6301 family protein [Prescottella agglutinans]MDH6279878.1 hypothetical protein [Prescottella agglutinans]